MAYIMLRYPNGKRKQKAFPAEASLLVGIYYFEPSPHSVIV